MVKRPKLLLKMLNVDLPKLLSSRFDKSSIVQYLACQRICIEPTVPHPIYLHIDGDTAGLVEKVEIEMKREVLNAVVPLGLE